MRSPLQLAISLFILFVFSEFAGAANGDTTYVKAHNRAHMSWYGNYDAWGVFNTSNKTFQRVWLKYTIGCPDNGCSQWDYTTNISIRQRTGIIDSTFRTAPDFKVDNKVVDTLRASSVQTFDYVFNNTLNKIDTVAKKQLLITRFLNANNPTQITDTVYLWPANFYQYSFDTTGKIIDSVLVQPDTTLIVTYYNYYQKNERINQFEIAKVITPYAGGYTKAWQNEFWFDITDYQILLRDSVQIRAFYSGYSDGFTATTEFYFIEGTPAKTVIGLENLWNGSFPFGVVTNPINNQLKTRTVKVPGGAVEAKINITPTGHGFGGSDGCAEFCQKTFYVKVDDVQIGQQTVWKDDCGLNPHFPQPGTWVYNRANWCPGSAAKTYEFKVNPQGKDSLKLNMSFEPYENQGNSNQAYIIGSHVIFYSSASNYQLDASVEDILAPSNNFKHNRYNPICNNALFSVKNFGSTSISSIEFSAKINNSPEQVFTWTGDLQYLAETEISIPYLNWTGASNNSTFEIKILKVNGASDENVFNNIKRSTFNMPTQTPLSIIVEAKTNLKPEENRLKVVNSEGKVIIDRTYSQTNSLHRDTLVLGHGCYTLEFSDSNGDGLDFFSSQRGTGTGFFRVMNVSPYNIIKTFNANFGKNIVFNFIAGMPLGESPQTINNLSVQVYPNPAKEELNILLSDMDTKDLTINVLNALGQKILVLNPSSIETKINTTNFSSGLHSVEIISGSNRLVKKVIIE